MGFSFLFILYTELYLGVFAGGLFIYRNGVLFFPLSIYIFFNLWRVIYKTKGASFTWVLLVGLCASSSDVRIKTASKKQTDGQVIDLL